MDWFRVKKGLLTKYSGDETIVVLPDNVVEIGERAFESCTRVEKIVLPDNVKKIQSEAFYCCTNLQEINIPASVSSIAPDIFAGYCPKSISCEEGIFFAKRLFAWEKLVPVPYIDCNPIPLDVEAYRVYFTENPQIKRIFALKDGYYLSPVSVNEFLSAIEDACATQKLYIREGHRMTADTYCPVTPERMVIDGGKYVGVTFEYTKIVSYENARGDWGNSFEHYTKILKPSDGTVTNVYDEYNDYEEETAALVSCADCYYK